MFRKCQPTMVSELKKAFLACHSHPPGWQIGPDRLKEKEGLAVGYREGNTSCELPDTDLPQEAADAFDVFQTLAL